MLGCGYPVAWQERETLLPSRAMTPSLLLRSAIFGGTIQYSHTHTHIGNYINHQIDFIIKWYHKKGNQFSWGVIGPPIRESQKASPRQDFYGHSVAWYYEPATGWFRLLFLLMKYSPACMEYATRTSSVAISMQRCPLIINILHAVPPLQRNEAQLFSFNFDGMTFMIKRLTPEENYVWNTTGYD